MKSASYGAGRATDGCARFDIEDALSWVLTGLSIGVVLSIVASTLLRHTLPLLARSCHFIGLR